MLLKREALHSNQGVHTETVATKIETKIPVTNQDAIKGAPNFTLKSEAEEDGEIQRNLPPDHSEPYTLSQDLAQTEKPQRET